MGIVADFLHWFHSLPPELPHAKELFVFTIAGTVINAIFYGLTQSTLAFIGMIGFLAFSLLAWILIILKKIRSNLMVKLRKSREF